jgi:bacteriocin-like protein
MSTHFAELNSEEMNEINGGTKVKASLALAVAAFLGYKIGSIFKK